MEHEVDVIGAELESESVDAIAVRWDKLNSTRMNRK